MKVAISKTDLFYGEMPVFYYNDENNQYEHIWGNGKRILFYSREVVEELDDKWVVFEIDRENHKYIRLLGNF